MRVAFVLAYPVYHDGYSAESFGTLENQNRWIPAVLAELGHEVEYWGGDAETSTRRSRMDGLPGYPLRLFATERHERRSKRHTSTALVEHAHAWAPDVVFVKGVDGGLGLDLFDRYLRPEHVPFGVVTGGAYRSRMTPAAGAVLYETAFQRDRLARPRWPWQRRVPPDRLVWLPKSVDTDLFAPAPPGAPPPDLDVVTACRLTERHKSFAELAALARAGLRVAVVGKGPDEAALRARYPEVEWVGWRPHYDLPGLVQRARVFLHNGLYERTPTRDFWPRVIPEAMACGAAVVAFEDAVEPAVLPDGLGLRVPRADVVAHVRRLVADDGRRHALGAAARAYAVAHLGRRSSRPALEAALARMAR